MVNIFHESFNKCVKCHVFFHNTCVFLKRKTIGITAISFKPQKQWSLNLSWMPLECSCAKRMAELRNQIFRTPNRVRYQFNLSAKPMAIATTRKMVFSLLFLLVFGDMGLFFPILLCVYIHFFSHNRSSSELFNSTSNRTQRQKCKKEQDTLINRSLCVCSMIHCAYSHSTC